MWWIHWHFIIWFFSFFAYINLCVYMHLCLYKNVEDGLFRVQLCPKKKKKKIGKTCRKWLYWRKFWSDIKNQKAKYFWCYAFIDSHPQLHFVLFNSCSLLIPLLERFCELSQRKKAFQMMDVILISFSCLFQLHHNVKRGEKKKKKNVRIWGGGILFSSKPIFFLLILHLHPGCGLNTFNKENKIFS